MRKNAIKLKRTTKPLEIEKCGYVHIQQQSSGSNTNLFFRNALYPVFSISKVI
jgi:hypothetical protein